MLAGWVHDDDDDPDDGGYDDGDGDVMVEKRAWRGSNKDEWQTRVERSEHQRWGEVDDGDQIGACQGDWG